MGFDVDISRSVLKHYGDVTKSIERLLETGGLLPPECQETANTVGIVSQLGILNIDHFPIVSLYLLFFMLL